MATTLTTLNVSPLAFLTAEKWQNHRRAYTYGNVLPLVVPLHRIPPFIISRDTADTGSQFTLVNFNTNEETSIQALMLITGLGGYTIGGKAMVRYPGSVALPGLAQESGLYFLRMEDDMGNLLYSEIFGWENDLENDPKYLKVEWWHGEDFVYPGGTIRYDFPFKMWCYLYTDIGKPERLKKEEVEERDGRKLPLKQISWKVFKFEFRAPEYLIDALDLIWQHDACEITHMGRVYEVEEFVLNTEWLEYGDFGRVTVEFRTDTVVVVNGRSLTDFDYEEEELGCFVANYNAIAWIKEGTPEYTGGYWTDEFGPNHSFVSGEYVVIENSLGINTLKQWNGATYINVTINDRETVSTAHDSRNPIFERDSFYFFAGITIHSLYAAPFVSNEMIVDTTITIDGVTFENTLIEVWVRTDVGDSIAGTFTDDEFFTGISFDAVGANAYWVRARTYVCSLIADSDIVALDGIGFDEIGDTEIE